MKSLLAHAQDLYTIARLMQCTCPREWIKAGPDLKPGDATSIVVKKCRKCVIVDAFEASMFMAVPELRVDNGAV